MIGVHSRAAVGSGDLSKSIPTSSSCSTFDSLPHANAQARPPRPDGRRRTVMLLMSNPLDCDALSLWCRHRLECDAVESGVDLGHGLARCEDFRPRLLALDPTITHDAIERCTTALRARIIDHLLILDSRPFEVRLADILPVPAASYISGAASPAALASAISEILVNDTRVFDPALAPRVRKTKQGYKITASSKTSLLALLSRRERQVMRLLAEGMTVSRCAQALELSHKTVDNHKSRIMGKLGVRKASELTVRAIQEGLIQL
jgi:DNA-binding NarL/FixJ family response regulator